MINLNLRQVFLQYKDIAKNLRKGQFAQKYMIFMNM